MRENSKEKLILERDTFSMTSNKPITWGEFKAENFSLSDTDVIHVGYSEPYNYSDSASDGYYFFRVTSFIEETDKEYQERQERNERQKLEQKQRRKETYLKLKQEFENES